MDPAWEMLGTLSVTRLPQPTLEFRAGFTTRDGVPPTQTRRDLLTELAASTAYPD